MRINLKSKRHKAHLVPVLSVEKLREMHYFTNGCWRFIDKYGDLTGNTFEKCRESIRYRYNETSGINYLISHHPERAITLGDFLRKFDKWFGIKNEYIDRGDYVLLKNKNNYWLSNIFLFEIFTLLCRSFHEMKVVNVSTLESWAKNALGCGEYFTESNIAVIINHQKLIKSIGINSLIGGVEDFDGLINFIESEIDYDYEPNLALLIINKSKAATRYKTLINLL